MWARLTQAAPEVLEGSSNRYQCWELVGPEKWVPDGYVCVRVDSRGAGRSPGRIDIWSRREARHAPTVLPLIAAGKPRAYGITAKEP